MSSQRYEGVNVLAWVIAGLVVMLGVVPLLCCVGWPLIGVLFA